MGKPTIIPIDNPEKVAKASNVYLSDGVTSVEDAMPKKKIIESVTSDVNGFIELGLPNTCDVIGVSAIGYSIFAWKRSTGYWYATVVNGSIVPVASSTFSNVEVVYIE